MLFVDPTIPHCDLSHKLSAIERKKEVTPSWPVTRSPWARDQVLEYEDTAFYLEADTFDLCGGHSTAEGIYHYHSTAGCLQEQAMIQAETSASEHSALLGWAYVRKHFV